MRRRQAIKSIGAALGSLPFLGFSEEGKREVKPEEGCVPQDMTQDQFQNGLRQEGPDFIKDDWLNFTDFPRVSLKECYRARATFYPPETLNGDQEVAFGFQVDVAFEDLGKPISQITEKERRQICAEVGDKVKQQVYDHYMIVGDMAVDPYGNVKTIDYSELH